MLPAWATEDVHLENYHQEWPLDAGRLTQELTAVLEPWLIRRIEHIGSTSIPGMVAKPIIDLMAMVEDHTVVAPQVADKLRVLGWEHVPPELDTRPWRAFFVKVSTDKRHRLAHLHPVSKDAERWPDQILFRNTLRADSGLCEEYARLKQALAKRYSDDREKYTAEKAAFIRGVLAGASKRR